jgi:hypothetical protein
MRQEVKVRDLIGRRETILAQARLDAERWTDDGGSFYLEAVPSAPIADAPDHATAAPPAEHYRCQCQHVLQVFGLGRHRRYYELADRGWQHPVMGRVCPSCQRGLPGKNTPHTTADEVVCERAPTQFGGRKHPLANREWVFFTSNSRT